jgi:hypothetical protein
MKLCLDWKRAIRIKIRKNIYLIFIWYKLKTKYGHLMERAEVSSCGFGRRPESSTRSSNDHHSKL